MPPLKVTLLGTGTSQGVPVVGCHCNICLSADKKDQRLRTSALLESGDTKVLIDAGPDLRQQMLQNKVEDLDAILITHEHQDHTAGLDEVRAVNFQQHHPVPVYARPAVQQRLREQFSYIFNRPDYPGLPQIELRELDEQEFSIGNLKITPITLIHKELEVMAFRLGDFTYITDANHIPPRARIQLEGTKYLVVNALRKESHYSHFNLQEALSLADDLGVQQAWFTHISHHMGLHAAVNDELPENRQLAYDGQVLTFNE